jgi:hypothetical protein
MDDSLLRPIPSARNPRERPFVCFLVEHYPGRSANGAAILVLGILGWVGLGIFTALPAWIMGNQSLAQIEAGQADPSERGLVQAGRMLGMILSILTLACIAMAALIFGGIALTAIFSG